MPMRCTRSSSEQPRPFDGWPVAGGISASRWVRERLRPTAEAGAPAEEARRPGREISRSLTAGHGGHEPGPRREGPTIAPGTREGALLVERLDQQGAVVPMGAAAVVETCGDLFPLPRREVEVRHVAAVGEARHRSREVAEVVELGGALVPEGLEVLRVDEVAHPHAVDIVAERVVLH